MDGGWYGARCDGLNDAAYCRAGIKFEDIEPIPVNAFSIVDYGRRATLIPVFPGQDTQGPIDEAAFLIEDPDQVFTLHGYAALLGYDHFDHGKRQPRIFDLSNWCLPLILRPVFGQRFRLFHDQLDGRRLLIRRVFVFAE